MNVVCPRCGVMLGLVEPLDRDQTVHRPCAACWPHVTGQPARFVYVSQNRPGLLRELVEEYRGARQRRGRQPWPVTECLHTGDAGPG